MLCVPLNTACGLVVAEWGTYAVVVNADVASLCSIADVSMTTKSAETEVASTYEFDCSGNILSSTPSHLPQGSSTNHHD